MSTSHVLKDITYCTVNWVLAVCKHILIFSSSLSSIINVVELKTVNQ